MILTVRNKFQQALFENELKGQLSDGEWENSKPYNHWESWCRAEVVVGENVGKDFYADRTRYNFSKLLTTECIEARMLVNCRLVAADISIKHAYYIQNYLFADLLDDCPFKGYKEWFLKDVKSGTKPHYTKVYNILELYNHAKLKEIAENESLYTLKMLKADLKDLQEIITL